MLKRKTFKMTPELLISFIEGKKVIFVVQGIEVEVLPPNYVLRSSEYQQGFDEGVKVQKALNEFADEIL